MFVHFFLIATLFYGIFSCPKSQNTPFEMVLIPEGIFIMGSNDYEHADFYPAHEVSVDSFYMDIHEVTNRDYMEFCKVTDHRLPEFWGMDIYKSGQDHPDHPVVGISFSDAKAYAAWKGKRLPTEAAWEYAARAAFIDKKFPHGEAEDPDLFLYNVRREAKGPVPVGSYHPNAYGLYDMAGNVWEWVADWYERGYCNTSAAKNPNGPEQDSFRVIRGGGWHSGPFCTRVYFRNGLPPNWCDFAVGFRCVQDIQ